MSAAAAVLTAPRRVVPDLAAGAGAGARGLRAAFYASPLYGLTLFGRAPRRLALLPPDPWPGDAAAGDRLFQGRYRFAGHETASPTGPVWAPPGVSAAWLDAMHGFDWLRHFKASGGEMARRHARALVADWIRECGGGWRPGAWDAAVTGRRIAAWTSCAGFLLSGADARWRSAFLANLGVQARHLARAARSETAGAPRISALRGLLHAHLCLGMGERLARRTAGALGDECERQALPEGGHIDRSPARHCLVLADLVDCRGLLRAAGAPVPAALGAAIDRMAPVLAALRHGDGGLAAFNDTAESVFPDPAAVLKAAAGTAARAAAGDSGFQRLAAGRTVVIVDAASAAGAESDHAGVSSFEMSVGAHRLIVNCGPHLGRGPEWADALRRTAAHSTLVLDDANIDAAAETTCERHAEGGAVWLSIAHRGYERRFGYIHRRRLYLSADGADLRGEDALLPAPGGRAPSPRRFAVRFHLHPSAAVSPTRDGRTAALRLPGGSRWTLRVSGGGLAVVPSVYFADDCARRRNEQAVVAGVCNAEGATVKWALRRE